MEYLGVVIEVKDNKAYVMTDSCEVVCIRKQPGMYEGLEVVFEPSEKINIASTVVKFAAIAGSVAAVFIAVFFYTNLFYSNQIYAYVDVDINANWELMLDKENRVIDIKTQDKNSERLFGDLDIKSKPIEIALVKMVEKLDENGVIDLKSDNKVLITACLQDNSGRKVDIDGLKKLEPSYSKIKNELSSRNIEPYIMEVESDYRKMADDNNISMGRYSIFEIGKQRGIDIDIETLKQSQIGDILEKVDISEEIKDINKDADSTTNPNNSTGQSSSGNTVNNVVDEGQIDLSVGGITDIDNIKSIESANMETQKIIQGIQQQINRDIAFETDKANREITEIRNNSNFSSEEKAERIKQVELNLNTRIKEINRVGNERVQAEVAKLEKRATELLPEDK